ncbi:MAG: hypothetical protein A3K66_06945 [Euryarchaeota archaeon RBG_16_67_27]|nr:MAG: hypothetical protein A3K66_06945 [Euryarchaeota archaeon RBG_16_67_27]
MHHESVWARRFIGVAIIQGAAAFVIAALMLVLTLFGASFGITSPSRIVASGSAGTWMFVGFSGFLIVGVLGVGLSALFYHYIEVVRGQRYDGNYKLLAWLHLILMNVGASGASWLFIVAGHVGGAAQLAGIPQAQVHERIVTFVLPIAGFMAVGAIGVFFGGIGYVLKWRKGSAGGA